ncbi:MAG: prepilin-type N-terminal cleavage/methylation domain-containing protein [Desulfobulbaceae bacterium]|nr:prepilin-type N-terminal cleavage/methylation domain-containing protein [Desulfobulbaceae bacterium]
MMLTDFDRINLAGSQKGVTLIELMVAMLLLVMVTSMLYSVLNVGIKFSQKGEDRLAVIGLERSFLDLLHRQVHGVWYDQRQKKLMIVVEENLLKMVTTSPLVERNAGLVLAVYLYDPGEEVLYYTEKLDFYNIDYDENYSPDPAEMIVLLRDIDEIDWQYDDTEGVLAVSYLGQEYELLPRSWQFEGEL